jgi:hypothetical protein
MGEVFPWEQTPQYVLRDRDVSTEVNSPPRPRLSAPSGNFKNLSRSACKVASENDMRAVLTTLDVPALKEHNP